MGPFFRQAGVPTSTLTTVPSMINEVCFLPPETTTKLLTHPIPGSPWINPVSVPSSVSRNLRTEVWRSWSGCVFTESNLSLPWCRLNGESFRGRILSNNSNKSFRLMGVQLLKNSRQDTLKTPHGVKHVYPLIIDCFSCVPPRSFRNIG